MPAKYFLGNQYLGSAPIVYWSDAQLTAASLLHVCPTCGEVWARVLNDPEDWVPLRSPCRRHPAFGNHEPGSFIFPWLTRLDALPPEVLRYEAILRLERFKDE